MAANAPALARARQGFAVEYGDLQPRTSNAYRNYFPLRNLGRLLAADGKVHCFAGEWDAGAESFLDACRIGEDLPHHGAMTSSLVGQSIAEFGYADCWAATTHVSAAEAHQAVARLEAMAATRVPEATVLEAGMWVRLASLLDYMRHNTAWRRELSGSDLPMLLHVYTYPERDLLEGIKREWDVVVTQAKRPYALRTHMTRRPDFLVDKLCWVQSGFGVEYNTNVAELNLLTVAFALRAYYLDHGAYPATLAALAPGYLTRVPGDPFAKSGALVYKPTGSSYLLYSIGPDGVDNGGTACTGGYLDAGSKGDIVAEVGAGKAAGTAKK